MTVQASDVLLLNRNVQESKNDYSLQTIPIGFLDQSHMLFNNGGYTDPRRKGREAVGTSGTGTTTPVNHYSFQSQPQLIDLPQLNNCNQHNVVSTGLRLAFNDQQHQLQQQQLQQQHGVLLSDTSSIFAPLLAEIRQQKEEIDNFLYAQGELMRRTIAEKTQRRYRAVLSAAEESILLRRLREKEAEVEKAARRNAELQARASQLSAEAHVWQVKARAEEAAAAALQAQLQQAIFCGGGGPSRDEEGMLTYAGGGECQAEDAESGFVDPDRVVPSGPVCKVCGKRVASAVLLPCRHLCVCTVCDGVVQSCPLCFSIRNESVHVAPSS